MHSQDIDTLAARPIVGAHDGRRRAEIAQAPEKVRLIESTPTPAQHDMAAPAASDERTQCLLKLVDGFFVVQHVGGDDCVGALAIAADAL